MSKLKLATLALALVAGAASAATQGTLGATSTGTFVNTFGAGARQVQILNLSDATVTPVSGNITWVNGDLVKGVQDKFCVVDTAAGAVLLKFVSSNGMGPLSHIRVAKTAAGVALPTAYTLGVGTAKLTVSAALHTTGFVVPAGTTVSAAANCGAGNVMKGITPDGGKVLPASSEIYTDTVTVTATPV